MGSCFLIRLQFSESAETFALRSIRCEERSERFVDARSASLRHSQSRRFFRRSRPRISCLPSDRDLPRPDQVFAPLVRALVASAAASAGRCPSEAPQANSCSWSAGHGDTILRRKAAICCAAPLCCRPDSADRSWTVEPNRWSRTDGARQRARRLRAAAVTASGPPEAVQG